MPRPMDIATKFTAKEKRQSSLQSDKNEDNHERQIFGVVKTKPSLKKQQNATITTDMNRLVRMKTNQTKSQQRHLENESLRSSSCLTKNSGRVNNQLFLASASSLVIDSSRASIPKVSSKPRDADSSISVVDQMTLNVMSIDSNSNERQTEGENEYTSENVMNNNTSN